jgi:hypothetical protein
MTDRVRGNSEAGDPRVAKIAAAHRMGLIEPENIAMAVFRKITGRVYPVDSGIAVS